MKKLTLLFALGLTFILAFSACEGPSGPRGYDGIDGNPGMETVFFEMSRYDWVSDGGGRWHYSFEMPEVTPGVVDYGAVLCYRQNFINGIETFEALPVTTLLEEEGEIFTNELWYTHYNGWVDFEWLDTHPFQPIPPNYDMTFKIVVLHPSYSYKVKNVDLNDYNAVAKALELENVEPKVSMSKYYNLK